MYSGNILAFSEYSKCCDEYFNGYVVDSKETSLANTPLSEEVYASVARNGVTPKMELDFIAMAHNSGTFVKDRPGRDITAQRITHSMPPKVVPVAALVHRDAPQLPLEVAVVHAHLLLGLDLPAGTRTNLEEKKLLIKKSS